MSVYIWLFFGTTANCTTTGSTGTTQHVWHSFRLSMRVFVVAAHQSHIHDRYHVLICIITYQVYRYSSLRDAWRAPLLRLFVTASSHSSCLLNVFKGIQRSTICISFASFWHSRPNTGYIMYIIFWHGIFKLLLRDKQTSTVANHEGLSKPRISQQIDYIQQ